MKTAKILGAAGALLLAVVLVSAALLPYYGQVQTTANVKQSIVFDGKEDNTAVTHDLGSVYGGDSACFKEIIKNRASVSGDVDLTTVGVPDMVGVTVTIYQVPDTVTLNMVQKDGNWNILDNGVTGMLVFDPDSPTFDYTFSATGLAASTDYSLIYYADPWAGNHPGAFIATFTTDASGNIASTSGSVDLGMNIPSAPDQNYASHSGGKIWLVTAADYDQSTNTMTAWNPENYLFESNLVVYTDCNLPIDCWMAPLLGTPIVNPLTVPAQGHVDLIFCYQFDIALVPGAYTFTTTAYPD